MSLTIEHNERLSLVKSLQYNSNQLKFDAYR